MYFEFYTLILFQQRESNPFVLSLEREKDKKDAKEEREEEKNAVSEGKEVEVKDKKVVVEEHSVEYAPGESNSDMFGGNSNWRGPIWICSRYLCPFAISMLI